MIQSVPKIVTVLEIIIFTFQIVLVVLGCLSFMWVSRYTQTHTYRKKNRKFKFILKKAQEINLTHYTSLLCFLVCFI